MEEESDKRAGGRQARQRDGIDRPGDQSKKPEKKVPFMAKYCLSISSGWLLR